MLPGRPSSTARAIALGRAVGLGDLRDQEVLALLSPSDRRLVRGLRALRPWRVPALGATGHAALRLHAVDAAITEAVAVVDPAVVVVVGAGLDTRAWRLEALRGRRVVEVDHPATQVRKRRGLATLDAVAADVVLVPADLRTDDLAAVLEAAGQDPSAAVVWVWEAVVPYLPPAAVDATLQVLAERSAAGSRLLVTAFTPGLLDPPWPVLSLGASVGLRAIGEPVLTAESESAFVARLDRAGWVSPGSTGPRDWAAQAGVTTVGPHLDERLHVAVRTGCQPSGDVG